MAIGLFLNHSPLTFYILHTHICHTHYNIITSYTSCHAGATKYVLELSWIPLHQKEYHLCLNPELKLL